MDYLPGDSRLALAHLHTGDLLRGAAQGRLARAARDARVGHRSAMRPRQAGAAVITRLAAAAAHFRAAAGPAAVHTASPQPCC